MTQQCEKKKQDNNLTKIFREINNTKEERIKEGKKELKFGVKVTDAINPIFN